MVKILGGEFGIGTTFEEFSLLPAGLTRRGCTIDNISLETKLADKLTLRIPLVSAAMQTVTGYEMVVELGKGGGMGVLPVALSIQDQTDIVRKVKKYEMSFVEDPVTIRETDTLEEVLRKIEKHGHSKIPVVDKNNIFLGMFTLDNYYKRLPDLQESVENVMIRFSGKTPLDLNEPIPYCKDCNISVGQVKELFDSNGKKQNYLVVLDNESRLQKLAFKKDTEKIPIASAISTHKGWQKRVEENVGAGVDLIVIDTSDAYSEFTGDVIKEYKEKRRIDVPLCAGNIVTYDGAMYLMKAGADIIKVGMSSGNSCTTKSQKGVGRAPMTALIDVYRAREQFYNENGRYIPIIMDGGIRTAADIVISLTMADAVMMGYYLNRFIEAAGRKFNQNGEETTIEDEIRFVEIFGEGSKEAQNLSRYGQKKITFYEQGIYGKIPCLGRLKPYLKEDISKIKDALTNAGFMNLKEFRENSVIELNSPYSNRALSTTSEDITQ